MNYQSEFQGWNEYPQSPVTNQLRILSDSLNYFEATKTESLKFKKRTTIKKCITQQSQSPQYKKNTNDLFNTYGRKLSTKRQASPAIREHQFNFLREEKKEINIKYYNNFQQPRNIKQSPIVQTLQRYQRQQLRTKLLSISRDINNSQINHILQLINK